MIIWLSVGEKRNCRFYWTIKNVIIITIMIYVLYSDTYKSKCVINCHIWYIFLFTFHNILLLTAMFMRPWNVYRSGSQAKIGKYFKLIYIQRENGYLNFNTALEKHYSRTIHRAWRNYGSLYFVQNTTLRCNIKHFWIMMGCSFYKVYSHIYVYRK